MNCMTYDYITTHRIASHRIMFTHELMMLSSESRHYVTSSDARNDTVFVDFAPRSA